MSIKNLEIFLKVLKIKLQKKTWDALEYDKGYMKTKFESNNIFPVDKDVNIYTVTVTIRAIKMVNTILNYF